MDRRALVENACRGHQAPAYRVTGERKPRHSVEGAGVSLRSTRRSPASAAHAVGRQLGETVEVTVRLAALHPAGRREGIVGDVTVDDQSGRFVRSLHPTPPGG